MSILDRVKSAWNAFSNTNYVDDPGAQGYPSTIYSGGIPGSGAVRHLFNDRTIVTAIYTRIAIDVASVLIKHIKLDDQGRYDSDVESSLNNCFRLEANVDQGPSQLRQDIAMTLFSRGVAAVVPVDTAVDPNTNQTFDIFTLRVGEIKGWYPKHVRVYLYNEAIGSRQEVTLEKSAVAVVENPLYMVMNEPNSTLQRLIRKLALLDAVDDQSGSGKLDLIIQLPYVIKSEARRQQAEQRRQEIEFQLKDSKYGIAYADGTEKITQLNRPTTNNLLDQVQYLITMLYGELGITDAVMNGTADANTMNNYWHRTVEPIVRAIVEAMQRSFIGPKAQSGQEAIAYFKNPFQFIPIDVLAEVVDKFTRNEVLSANEMRGFMGIIPSRDPKADKLINSNMPVSDTQVEALATPQT